MQVSAEMSKEKPKVSKKVEKKPIANLNPNSKHFLKGRMMETIIKDDEV